MSVRVRILAIIPFVILGFLLGYVSARAHGQTWLLTMLAIAILLVILGDMFSVARSVVLFGEGQYTVGIQVGRQLYSVFHLLLALSGVFLITFVMFPLPFLLPFLLLLFLTIRYGVRNKISNSINKCGVLYWGTHHKWADITGYQLSRVNGETQITFFSLERFAGLELDRKMCIRVSTEKTPELEDFIRERIAYCKG